MALLSRAGYARHRKCSLYAVQVAIKNGRISVTDDDKIDAEAADRQWAAETDPSKGKGRQKAGDGEARDTSSSFAEARRQREQAMAGLARLKLREKKAEVLQTSKVMAAWAGEIQRCRARLLAIPTKIAPLMIGVRTVAEAKRIAEEVVHEALGELSQPDLTPKKAKPRRKASRAR
jgi:hypothetical protein